MNWLSRIRRTLAASLQPASPREDAGDSVAHDDTPKGTAPHPTPSPSYDSALGYGALVIGTSHPTSRPH